MVARNVTLKRKHNIYANSAQRHYETFLSEGSVFSGWLDGWMDGWTDGWFTGRMDGWPDRWSAKNLLLLLVVLLLLLLLWIVVLGLITTEYSIWWGHLNLSPTQQFILPRPWDWMWMLPFNTILVGSCLLRSKNRNEGTFYARLCISAPWNLVCIHRLVRCHSWTPGARNTV